MPKSRYSQGLDDYDVIEKDNPPVLYDHKERPLVKDKRIGFINGKKKTK